MKELAKAIANAEHLIETQPWQEVAIANHIRYVQGEYVTRRWLPHPEVTRLRVQLEKDRIKKGEQLWHQS